MIFRNFALAHWEICQLWEMCWQKSMVSPEIKMLTRCLRLWHHFLQDWGRCLRDQLVFFNNGSQIMICSPQPSLFAKSTQRRILWIPSLLSWQHSMAPLPPWCLALLKTEALLPPFCLSTWFPLSTCKIDVIPSIWEDERTWKGDEKFFWAWFGAKTLLVQLRIHPTYMP